MKNTRAALALLLAASMLAACGGGANSPVPRSPAGAAREQFPKRIYYTREYLKAHPGLVWGARASFNRHAMQTGASASNLLWGGGPVEHTPKVYLIFWGWQSSTDTSADPDGLAAYLTNFMNSIGAGTWINTDTQYYDGSGSITNPAAQLGGVWYDSSKPPDPYADADIGGEALAGVAHFGYDADANYFVVTPHNVTTSGFGTQWCAYHSATYNSSNSLVSYTDLPYVPDAGASCGAGFVNSPGTLDGVSIVGGHEESETQTDPNASSGWIDSSGQEIGDKCAWDSTTSNVTFPDGQSYPVQPLWSNASSSCVLSYGTVVTPSPSPTPTATPISTPTPVPTATPTSTPAPTPTPCKKRHGRCH